MPNWCYNKLTVWPGKNGTAEDLKRFQEESKIWPDYYPERDDDRPLEFGFSGTVPIPQPVVESKDICDWCYANWGVKWDPSEVEILMDNNNLLEIEFQTPWGPPSKWLDTVIKVP